MIPENWAEKPPTFSLVFVAEKPPPPPKDEGTFF